jgi:hypothetical protein
VTAPPIVNPRLRQLYEWWLSKRGGRSFPSRRDFDPIDLRFILGNVILVDVIGSAPPDFRIRLHGSNLVSRHGYELTGKTLDALPVIEQRDRARQTFTAVATTGEPLHGHRNQLFAEVRRRYETIILPLAADGENIDMLLVGLIHDDEK